MGFLRKLAGGGAGSGARSSAGSGGKLAPRGFAARSPWLIHYDGSSCNGCDIEVLDCLTPLYDIERFGIINTGNPKHADIFLVTGSVNAQNKAVVQGIYQQMLEPKVVVACGVCACTGGVFRDCYNVLGGVDKAIPVDVYAPGCAVRPETIIDAVLEGAKILDEKERRMRAGELPAGAAGDAAAGELAGATGDAAADEMAGATGDGSADAGSAAVESASRERVA